MKPIYFLTRTKKNTLLLMLNNSLNLQWITGISKIVERFFSRSKLTLNDQRKRVLPMHFELLVFIFANKRLSNIRNVENVVAKIG